MSRVWSRVYVVRVAGVPCASKSVEDAIRLLPANASEASRIPSRQIRSVRRDEERDMVQNPFCETKSGPTRACADHFRPGRARTLAKSADCS